MLCCTCLSILLSMAPASFSSLFFMLVFHLPVYAAQEVPSDAKECPPSYCGDVEIKLPFSQITNPGCGFYIIECVMSTEPESTKPTQKIIFGEGGIQYVVKNVSYTKHELTIEDNQLHPYLVSNNCSHLNNFTVTNHPLLTFNHTSPKLTFLSCNKDRNPPDTSRRFRNYMLCDNIYYTDEEDTPPPPPPGCSIVQFPMPLGFRDWWNDDFLVLFSVGFSLQSDIFPHCFDCQQRGGRCDQNQEIQSFKCFDSRSPDVPRKVIVGLSAGIGSFFIACFLCFLYYRRRRKHLISSQSTLLSSNYPSDSSLRKDLEKSSSHFFTHIFSYKELEEATNNFHSSKELGDGGFGTVYHGKLRDGRSVAVKRLYENNYKRVEQFMNEVAILSGLRHQNLVSLYGCTSRHSRELLLVYEYVPNGTVADHLHGDRAKPEAPLTWPFRLSIAIETAEALSYLHAIEPQIIHRDVKTNNILLDSNFHVKVADFGLSRLFPMDVTHVSTAPQGTPGYVDPDYHQCYQLTDKSDVYSFGVVLMELISSKPAVDITRHRHEINLATMAINKIQNQALDELVDPKIGCESDSGVKRMVTLVAELGFRCLQLEKDMRPSMEEVVEILKGIESEGYRKVENLTAVSPSVADDVVLLKVVAPFSPDSVIEKWSTRSTTPNTKLERRH